jgi:hypothetical protein
MKLSRRGKSVRRGRHTKRAGKNLRYKGKKVRGSKRHHRAHKRTYKRGKRFHRGGEVNCESIVNLKPWSTDPESTEVTNIPKVNLKYKKNGTLMYAYSDFNVVLFVYKNNSIKIQFRRVDPRYKSITFDIMDLSMFINPGLSNWKVTEGDESVSYSFDYTENNDIFYCIQKAINEKKGLVTSKSPSLSEDYADDITLPGRTVHTSSNL